ncbi:hypothetical protein ACRRTK_013970 [Alexandromys fortis]
MTTASPSQVRQNYHQDLEAAINRQINLELYASYVYLSISCYFDRDDVALRNFAKYFLYQSHEEREHTEKLMKQQNERGSRIFLQDIKKPDSDDWENWLNAMECSLHLEKSVNQPIAINPCITMKLWLTSKLPAFWHLSPLVAAWHLLEPAIKNVGDMARRCRRNLTLAE